ncbi:MAG TPA: hypothetical protein VLM37_12620 [Fibrobacteraceae bacterium]|nr:hypothetical protein [Fibrobacteraceae bacterium]
MSKYGLATDFLIGYGATEKLLLQYENSDSWYSAGSSTFYDAVGLFGCRFYLEDEAPSLFFNAQLGLASFVNYTESESASGFGWAGSIGFEPVSHLELEIKYLHTSTSNNSFDHKSNAFQFLISYLYY